MSQSDIPRASLEDALKLAQALRDNFAGKDASPINLAAALNRSPSSSTWRFLTGAATAYGLTTAGWNADSISLTSLGNQIVSPTEDGADRIGLIQAALRPAILKSFYEKYDRNKLPNEQIAKNVLVELGVPQDRASEAFKIATENAKFVSILTGVAGNQYIQLRATSTVSVPSNQNTVETDTSSQSSPEHIAVSRPHIMDTTTPSGYANVNVADGRIVLVIPASLKDRLLDDEGVEKEWHEVRRALKSFADKHIPKKEDKSSASE